MKTTLWLHYILDQWGGSMARSLTQIYGSTASDLCETKTPPLSWSRSLKKVRTYWKKICFGGEENIKIWYLNLKLDYYSVGSGHVIILTYAVNPTINKSKIIPNWSEIINYVFQKARIRQYLKIINIAKITYEKVYSKYSIDFLLYG